MHFQNVWRYELMNYVECEKVSVNGIPKLTTALKARQVSFLLLASCAWWNLFTREATRFPTSFEFDHLTWLLAPAGMSRRGWKNDDVVQNGVTAFSHPFWCHSTLWWTAAGADTRGKEWRFPDVLWLRPHLQGVAIMRYQFWFYQTISNTLKIGTV